LPGSGALELEVRIQVSPAVRGNAHATESCVLGGSSCCLSEMPFNTLATHTLLT